MTTMEGRVSEGAKWMDRHRSGWVGRVRPERLEMQYCTSCVLGQDVGDYHEVVGREDWFSQAFNDSWAIAHGFLLWADVPDDVTDVEYRATYDRLREAWVTEILSRRFAEQQHEPASVETPVSVESR